MCKCICTASVTRWRTNNECCTVFGNTYCSTRLIIGCFAINIKSKLCVYSICFTEFVVSNVSMASVALASLPAALTMNAVPLADILTDEPDKSPSYLCVHMNGFIKFVNENMPSVPFFGAPTTYTLPFADILTDQPNRPPAASLSKSYPSCENS